MIKFEYTSVMNLKNAFRGLRNPLNSWDKSDSFSDYFGPEGSERFIIGDNDLALAQRLIKAGSDHRKFMRQIFVSVDITAPLYWWKEFDTYKVATVANSCSTMHKIHDKELTLADFSTDHLFNGVERCEFDNDDMEYYENPTTCLEYTIKVLNYYREKYLATNNKEYWYQIIQLLPSSYNQRRTVTLNYETIRAIRHSDRRNHKLDEWRIGFMEWIDSLPYADELIKI